MNDYKHIIDCYNKTAETYADKFMDELKHKHLDRILLKAFAEEHKHSGKLIDLGCGPGQTTKFLFDCGIQEITGIDISPGMIETAKKHHPQLRFEVADMLHLPFTGNTFAAAIAFYAIVHFTTEQLERSFQEIRRILKNKGELLFSFHVGEETIHLDEFLEQKVHIDFHFFDTAKLIELLVKNGFELIDALERQPYNHAEYPSKRAYIWARAVMKPVR
jgi:ubiquinone/menaquinone biosynthesis C-methylase UbiE